MDLEVRTQRVDAYKDLMRIDAPAGSCRSHNAPAEEKKPRLSSVAGEIPEALAYARRRTGARLRLSTLHLPRETDPALAAATSELASVRLVRVSGMIELTSEGYDLIQAHVFQERARALGPAPNP